MKILIKSLIFVIVAANLVLAGKSYGESFIYPDRGQSQEQQTKDLEECHGQAKEQADIDPTQPVAQADAQSSPQEQPNREQRLQAYEQSLATCMKQRGYTLK